MYSEILDDSGIDGWSEELIARLKFRLAAALDKVNNTDTESQERATRLREEAEEVRNKWREHEMMPVWVREQSSKDVMFMYDHMVNYDAGRMMGRLSPSMQTNISSLEEPGESN